jgi:hypothetical protein
VITLLKRVRSCVAIAAPARHRQASRQGGLAHANAPAVRYSVLRHGSEIMLGVLVVILRPDYVAGLSLSFG